MLNFSNSSSRISPVGASAYSESNDFTFACGLASSASFLLALFPACPRISIASAPSPVGLSQGRRQQRVAPPVASGLSDRRSMILKRKRLGNSMW
jgi:hypothetical protein